MELPKDQEGLFKLARARGWRIDRTTSGHWRLESPQKRVVITSGTASDFRAVKNFRMNLKRAGLVGESVVTRPQLVLKEPKLVVDKNPQSPVAAPAPTKVRRESGVLRDTILEAMRKVNRGGGMETSDIFAHVVAKLPEMTKSHLSVTMNGMMHVGWLKRESLGRYSIVPGGPQKKKRMPGSKRAAAPVVDYNTDDDFKALEEVLGCLTRFEAIVRKHQAIAKTFAGLKGLINQIGGVNGQQDTKGEGGT